MATRHESTITLRLRRTYPASRERIFRAWTTPEELTRWHAPAPLSTPSAEVDLRVGGKYRIAMRDPSGAEYHAVGVYREIDRPRKLVFTWGWEERDIGPTLVTIELFEKGEGTELVLTHEKFPNEQERDQHQHGWNGVLDKLAQFISL